MKHSLSATWTQLPERWLTPILDGVLLMHEAAELWDLFLLNPGEWVVPPAHLRSAVERLELWQAEVSVTVH